MLTIGLVVMVIFMFLRTLAATVIPSVAVPLSLVGTFGAMYLLGYSLNNLTLMALTISTGFVVDDAIVMIENIARYIEAGDPPLQAALKGAEQIGFTIMSLTVSLIAVLIPLLFMGDIVGRLFREFAITLSVTILISAAVSLSLTPMMCARLLHHKPESERGWLYQISERIFQAIIRFYGRTLTVVLRHQPATMVVAAGTLVATLWLFYIIPKGFFPVQDTGVILGVSEAPQTISFPAMSSRQQALVKVILKDPAVESLSSFIGVDGTNTTINSGRIQINLKPLEQRKIKRERRYSPPAAGTGPGGRHSALYAAGAGFDGRGSREPHAISIQPRGSRSPRTERMGSAFYRQAANPSGFARCRERCAERRAAGDAGDRSQHGLAVRDYACK